MDSSEPNPNCTSREVIAVLAWLGVLFVWTVAPLAGYDFWFYLAMGREIVENKEIPIEESFLGTTSSLAFANYADMAWLGNLLCYAVYSVFGWPGLVGLKSALLTVSTGVVYLANRVAGLSPFWAGAWATLALWTVRGRFEMRTYLFTTLALAFLSLLILSLEKGLSWRKGALALACLFALWTNLHQGVLAGYLVLGSWLVFGRRCGKIRIGLSGLAVVCSLVRPNLLSLPGFYYDHFANSRAIQGVVEWAAPSWPQRLSQLGPFYLVLLWLAIITLARLSRRLPLPSPTFGVTSLAFSLAGFRAIRSVAELLPVVAPLVAPYFPKLPRRGWLPKSAALLLTLLLFTTWHSHNLKNLERVDGMPQNLLTHLPSTGQVLNSFEFGNFLVFAEVPPFIHGMTALYREQLIFDFEDILNPTERREALLTRYDVTSALLHHPTADDATLLLVEYLAKTPGWKLAAWDDSGLIFVRGDKAQGLTEVQPWNEPPWKDPKAAENELRQLLQQHPSALAGLLLSRLLLEKGSLSEATAQAADATRLAPTFSLAWTQLGLCYARSGNLSGVLLASEQAIRLAPGDATNQLNYAVALKEMSNQQSGPGRVLTELRSRYHARRALWISPTLEPARRLLGLSSQGD